MKKRLLSMLMAMCLMATMVPAAFAADEENGRPIPDELPIVYEEDAVALVSDEMTADYPGSGTQDDPIVVEIHDKSDFQYLVTACQNYTGKYYKVTLMTDLNLEEMGGTKPAQWKGYLNFFMGTFDGNGKTISGIPEDCYLFQQIHNADIGNFKLDLNGKAATLMYFDFRIKMKDGSIEWGNNRLHDIDVISGATIQLKGNAQANYAPFMFAAGSYFTMENCNNYANINGDTYAAVFSGYYPLPASGYPSDSYFKFIDCENHGDVTLRYAGLFFGNPTGLRADRNITFDGVKNYGVIRGIDTAHFFSSDAGANDYFTGTGYFSEQEDSLDPKDENGDFVVENNPMRLTCTDSNCLREEEHSGALFEREDVSDLKVQISKDGKGYQVVVPEGTNPNYKYVVNAYCYVSLFLIQKDENNKEILVPDGTTRITQSEEVSANNDYTTKVVKNAPLRDGELPETYDDVDLSQCLYFCNEDDENYYGYWLDSEDVYHGTHRLFINHSQEPGVLNWSVYVSVYDGDKLVDTAVLDRQGGTQ